MTSIRISTEGAKVLLTIDSSAEARTLICELTPGVAVRIGRNLLAAAWRSAAVAQREAKEALKASRG